MAITKILPVRGQLKGCLDYAANPQKTEYLNTADRQRLMNYTQNGDKTEHQFYVSGFNCDPQNAYYLMQATKRRWGKPLDSGNVGYHIIQSFKPGEATPDQVHEIGCEFARRFLADRFECTVSTHLDKGHLHNHIVVNSVSFMDGCSAMILLLTTRVSELFPMNCAAKIDCLLWKQTDTGNPMASGNTKKKAHPRCAAW